MSELNGSNNPIEADSETAEWAANLAERVQAGEPVDLCALALEHPGRAEVLRSLLPAIEAMARHARFSAGRQLFPSVPWGRAVPSACFSSSVRSAGAGWASSTRPFSPPSTAR